MNNSKELERTRKLKIMTKTQSLKRSIKIWKLVAKSGAISKYLALAQFGWYEIFHSNCPLCEFVQHDENGKEYEPTISRCEQCPMYGKWGGVTNSPKCYDRNTMYYHWEHSSTKATRKIWAKRIVIKLKEVLKHEQEIKLDKDNNTVGTDG